MYGYIRPRKSELKIREYSLYRAAYCGLCHTLAREYGFPARFLVSYDMASLAMLLYTGEGFPELQNRRCPVHPLRPVCVACRMDAGAHTAAVTVLLFLHKLRDTVRDERLPRRLAARIGLLLFRRAGRRAARLLPAFAEEATGRLAALAEAERAGERSIDRAADHFAALTAAAGTSFPGREGDAALSALLYQVGRAVYIADALEDVEEDAAAGRYNPITRRLGISTRAELIARREETDRLWELSLSEAAGQLPALPRTVFTPILENILLLGLPDALTDATEGKKKQTPSHKE